MRTFTLLLLRLHVEGIAKIWSRTPSELDAMLKFWKLRVVTILRVFNQ